MSDNLTVEQVNRDKKPDKRAIGLNLSCNFNQTGGVKLDTGRAAMSIKTILSKTSSFI